MNNVPRHQRPTNLKKFLFGCPYYPEHWTEADRRDDPARMAAAGMNVVRMAEFAWDRMEPQAGKMDFSFFDEQIARLGAAGVSTILCTPTATPPRWLTLGHPDWMRINSEGLPMLHGGRQQCCTNNEGFRAQSRRITAAMAEHFAANPHVIGWQTDNELYCHISACYCPSCTRDFRQWLRRKYGTIDNVNTAWGTAFWALTYNDFEPVELPFNGNRPAEANPSHTLDHYRYLSDSLIEFQRQQVQILRQANREWFVTHNGMFSRVDYWRFTEDLDFLGVDNYPMWTPNHPQAAVSPAVLLQRARSVSGGFVVPEQQAGYIGFRSGQGPTPAPGQMRLWAYQSMAHGADGVLHFRWRTCRFGVEEYWGGVLDHDNVPRRRYRELAQEGEELKRLGPKVLHTVLDVQAGALIENDQDDAHAVYPQNLPSPQDQAGRAFGQMWKRHLPCGLIQAADSFEGLKLLVVPSMLMMDEALAARLRAFVEQGGVLLVTARTGSKDRNGQVIAQSPPGPLAELCGVTVQECGAVDPGLMSIDLGGPNRIAGGNVYEILALNGARSLGRWAAPADIGPCAPAGEVAFAINRLGAGWAIYAGTYLTDQNVAAVLNLALERAPIAPLAEAPVLVEVTRRLGGQRPLTFVLNHYPSKQAARTRAGMELLTGALCDGNLELPPYGVAVIEESDL